MTGLRQLKPKEKMLLLILLNENKPVSVHKLSHIAGISTQKTLQKLYSLTKGLRLILTINQEAEIAVSEEADFKENNSGSYQNNLFEDNKT